jgi:type II secretory pathway component PulF
MLEIKFLIIVGLVVFAFCAGLLLPTLGKALAGTESRAPFLRGLLFLKSKAGYLASFALGALIAVYVTYNFSPYTAARISGLYEYTVLGSLIASDEEILKTGQIPQKILDSYAEYKID